MHLRSLILEWGWVGFGMTRGNAPSLCLGPVRLWSLDHSIYSRMQRYEAALRAGATNLQRRATDYPEHVKAAVSRRIDLMIEGDEGNQGQ